jgi:hypothetical protein
MNRSTSSILVFFVCVAGAVPALGQPTIIGGVPDWNQPNNYVAAPDLFVQPPDPPPAPGGVASWCVPTSAANLMGWYEDVNGAPVADNLVYSVRQQPYPNLDTNVMNPGVPDGLPDYQQNRWMDGQIELGYWMDTQGWLTNNPLKTGTALGAGVADIPNGITSYLLNETTAGAQGWSWDAWNFDLWNDGGNPAAASWSDYLSGAGTVLGTIPPGPHPANNGVNFGLPVMVSWDWWNPVTPWQDDANGVTWYTWGTPGDEAHCVTGMGFMVGDPDAGGPLPNARWLICHDNWPGTGHPLTGNVAIPWSDSLWWGNTHISLVPEPATLGLLALGALMLLRRRHRTG